MTGEKYAIHFEKYWESEGRSTFTQCSELYNSLKERMKSHGDEAKKELKKYLENNQNPKGKLQQITAAFNGYLKRCGHENDVIEFEVAVTPESGPDTTLAILKQFHRTKSVEKTAEALGLSEKTVDNHVRKLKQGISIHGSEIKVNVNRSKKNGFLRSNVHPVFLALNSTEVYHLMKYLSMADKSNDVIRKVGDKIYSQLTEYAKKVICHDVRCFKGDACLDYSDDYSAFADDMLSYVFKALPRIQEEGRHLYISCSISNDENGETVEYEAAEVLKAAFTPILTLTLKVGDKEIEVPCDENFDYYDIFETSDDCSKKTSLEYR